MTDQVAVAQSNFEALRGRWFRRRHGKKPYKMEHVYIDKTYLTHYNFVNVTYRLRDTSGRTVTVDAVVFPYDWREADADRMP